MTWVFFMLVVSEMKNPSHHLYCPFSPQDEFGRGLGRWTFHQATQVVGSKAVRGAEAGLGQVTINPPYLKLPNDSLNNYFHTSFCYKILLFHHMKLMI